MTFIQEKVTEEHELHSEQDKVIDDESNDSCLEERRILEKMLLNRYGSPNQKNLGYSIDGESQVYEQKLPGAWKTTTDNWFQPTPGVDIQKGRVQDIDEDK